MDKKSNYFGRELERALLVSGVKNYTVAKALNYDVSYISKWISGKMLPSKKNADRICAAAAQTICSQISEEKMEEMAKQYGVAADTDRLTEALTAGFADAYYISAGITNREKYVNNASLKTHPSGNGPLLLDFLNEIDKDRSVDAAVMADFFSLEHAVKLQLAGISQQRFCISRKREDVHLCFMIDMEKLRGDRVYDVILLIHLLTHYSLTDFHLYSSREAAGKLLLAVSGEYCGVTALSGQQYLCTTSARDSRVSKELYDNLLMEADPDQQLFFPAEMEDLLLSHEYIRSLLSQDLKWLAGHLTEHFLEPEIFDKAACQIWSDDSVMRKEAEKFYQMTLRTAEKNGLALMIYDTALTNFILSGEVDFFNHKVILSPEDRKKQLRYMKQLLLTADKLKVKMIRGGFSDDFKYITNPCIFLSESVQMLRLENRIYRNNILLVQDKSMQEIFQTFFDEIWNNREDVVLSDRKSLQLKLKNLMESADLLCQM